MIKTIESLENDSVIKVITNDTDITELHFQIKGESSWIVIGYNDIKRAIKLTKQELNVEFKSIDSKDIYDIWRMAQKFNCDDFHKMIKNAKYSKLVRS